MIPLDLAGLRRGLARDLIYRRIIPVVKIRRWIRIPKQEALEALQKYKIRGVTV
jgi:hypothetical protein